MTSTKTDTIRAPGVNWMPIMWLITLMALGWLGWLAYEHRTPAIQFTDQEVRLLLSWGYTVEDYLKFSTVEQLRCDLYPRYKSRHNCK